MLSDWKTMHQALSHIHAILYVVFTYSYTYTSEKITNKWHLSALLINGICQQRRSKRKTNLPRRC